MFIPPKDQAYLYDYVLEVSIFDLAMAQAAVSFVDAVLFVRVAPSSLVSFT